jgi:hypothetical protein
MDDLKYERPISNTIASLDLQKEYSVNENAKNLLNINDAKITQSILNRKIYEYVSNNNLLEQNNIIRVNTELAKILNLSHQQINQINNAKSVTDYGCLSTYNIMYFGINFFEHDPIIQNV